MLEEVSIVSQQVKKLQLIAQASDSIRSSRWKRDPSSDLVVRISNAEGRLPSSKPPPSEGTTHNTTSDQRIEVSFTSGLDLINAIKPEADVLLK